MQLVVLSLASGILGHGMYPLTQFDSSKTVSQLLINTVCSMVLFISLQVAGFVVLPAAMRQTGHFVSAPQAPWTVGERLSSKEVNKELENYLNPWLEAGRTVQEFQKWQNASWRPKLWSAVFGRNSQDQRQAERHRRGAVVEDGLLLSGTGDGDVYAEVSAQQGLDHEFATRHLAKARNERITYAANAYQFLREAEQAAQLPTKPTSWASCQQQLGSLLAALMDACNDRGPDPNCRHSVESLFLRGKEMALTIPARAAIAPCTAHRSLRDQDLRTTS